MTSSQKKQNPSAGFPLAEGCFLRIADRLEHHRGRQLKPPIKAAISEVLNVKVRLI
jgi:hypothetical protein